MLTMVFSLLQTSLLLAQMDSASASPLVTWEVALPQRGGMALWARNSTTDTVWVDSLHVEACVNIRRKGCGSHGLNLAFPPHARKQLLRLEPVVPAEAFGYRWSLDWRVVSPDSVKARPRRSRAVNTDARRI